MSEVLDGLNAPNNAPEKSWAEEVAAAASEAPEKPVEAATPEPAPVQPETAEAPVEAQVTPENGSDEPDRRVPLKALQEERQKRAQYEQMLMQREQEMMQMRAWIEQQQMQQQGQPPEPEQIAEPDPETDPIGALKAARDQLKQMQAQAQEQAYVQQLNEIAYNAAEAAKQQVPDYQDAYRYAINSRAQELLALGTPQHHIPAILQQEELRLIDSTVRAGRNPAEAIYQFAKARGFQSKQASPAPVAAPAPSAPDPVMAQAKAAVAASASAGGAPASKGTITPADLANLNGAAFDSAWNKLFGGNKSSVFRE